MRKFLYVLLGVVLIGGAVATFGTRNLGWDVPRMSNSDHGGGQRSFANRDWGGGGGGWREDRGGGRGGSWLNFSNILDLLNVLVGVVGIALTISGMRMQRNAMQMSMRGRD